MVNDVKPAFVSLFAICVSSLVKVCWNLLAILHFYYWLLRAVFSDQKSFIRYAIWEYFLLAYCVCIYQLFLVDFSEHWFSIIWKSVFKWHINMPIGINEVTVWLSSFLVFPSFLWLCPSSLHLALRARAHTHTHTHTYFPYLFLKLGSLG
jgi:hypothetical protein